MNLFNGLCLVIAVLFFDIAKDYTSKRKFNWKDYLESAIIYFIVFLVFDLVIEPLFDKYIPIKNALSWLYVGVIILVFLYYSFIVPILAFIKEKKG